MNVEMVANTRLNNFFRGDTLNLVFEFIAPDGNILDISGIKFFFTMKLNPLSAHLGAHDIFREMTFPFNDNSRKGLGSLTVLTKDTVRLIPLSNYQYDFSIVTIHNEMYTIGSDNVEVQVDTTRVPYAMPYSTNAAALPTNAMTQIIIFDFSKTKTDQYLFNQLEKGLQTDYSNSIDKSILDINTLPINVKGGIAGLDEHGRLPINLLPDELIEFIKHPIDASPDDVFIANSESAMLNLIVKQGDMVIRMDKQMAYMNHNGYNNQMADWTALPITSTSSSTAATLPVATSEGLTLVSGTSPLFNWSANNLDAGRY